jgi:hypothetical protein
MSKRSPNNLGDIDPASDDKGKGARSMRSKLGRTAAGAVFAAGLGIGLSEGLSSSPEAHTVTPISQAVKLFDELKSVGHSTLGKTAGDSASIVMRHEFLEGNKQIFYYPFVIETPAKPSEANGYSKVTDYFAYFPKPENVLTQPSTELAKELHLEEVDLPMVGDPNPNGGGFRGIQLDNKGNMYAQVDKTFRISVGVAAINANTLNPTGINQAS